MNGKRIAFAQPYVRDYSALDLGVLHLATYLNARTEHRAEIVDLVFHSRDWRRYLAQELARIRPDYVAVSTNKLYLVYVQELTRVVHNMGYPVVVGGHEASCNPQETLVATGADYAMTGDGETSMVPFLNGDGRPGQRVWHGSFVADLDSLPCPDYSLWRYVQRYNFLMGINAIGSRGCVFRCSFCSAHEIQDKVGGQYYRVIGPKTYASNLTTTSARHHPRFFQLFDPIFTAQAPWVEQFCAEYRSLGAPTPFSIFSRIDHLDERRIKALASANCRIVRVGIESGNDHIRMDVLKKSITSERIRQVVALCKQHGIAQTAYYMLGCPEETPATVRDTIRLACEVDCERSAFFIWKAISPEGVEQMKGCGGRINLDRSDNISWSAQADMPGLSGRRVELFQAEAYARTFSRRLLRLVKAQRTAYAKNLLEYVVKGLYWGLDFKYLIAYSQVYAGESALM